MTPSTARTAFLVPMVAMLSLSACDLLVSADARVARARTALEAGKLESALADLRKVVEKDKGRADAWLLMSRISLKYGDAESALKDLERAQASGAQADAVQAMRDEALLLAGRFEDLLKDSDSSKSPSHEVAVATAQVALGRSNEARRTLDAVLATDAGHVEGRLLQIRMLLADGKAPEARAAIDSLLAQKPDSARAHLLKAQLSLADGDTAAAIAGLTSAQALAASQLGVPEQVHLLGALTEVQLQAGDAAAAAKWQSQMQQRAPQAALTQLLSARVSLAQGDATAAVATLQRLLAATPDLAPARLLLGAALMEQGSTEQALQHLSNVVAEQPDDLGARKLLAQLHMSQGDTQEASRVMAAIPAGSASDSGADWLRSSILAVSGQTADALALLEQAARSDPRNIPLQLDLARAYLQTGRHEDARKVMQTVPPEKAGKAGNQLRLLAQVIGQSMAETRQTLTRMGTENPGDAPLLSYIAQLQSEMGDIDAAADTFRKALVVQPTLAEAHLGLAGIALRRSDVQSAEAELKLVVTADSRNEKGYLGLAALAVQQGKPADAERLLEQAISAVPAAVQSRVALATLALGKKDADRARSLLTQAVEVSRNKGATLVSAGDAYLAASLPAEALTRFQDAAKRGQRDAFLKVATAQFALNQTEEGRRSLESAAASHPEWPPPVAMLVSLDASERKYDRALQRIDRLRKAGGPEAACEELRGGVLMAQGSAMEAERAFTRAYQLQPQSELASKLYMARRTAKTAEPHAVLRQWLARQPGDVRVRAMLALHLQGTGDTRGAISEYEIAARAAPTPELLNNLAWVYQLAKDPRALDTAKRAYDAAPGNEVIADTYGWVLVESGRAKEALPILEKAAKALPGDKEVQAHYSRAKSEAEK